MEKEVGQQKGTKEEDPESKNLAPNLTLTPTTGLLKEAGSYLKNLLFHYSSSLRMREPEITDGCRSPNPRGWMTLGTWRRSYRR